MSTEATAPGPAELQITFALFAMLTDYLPKDGHRGNERSLRVPAGSSIADVIAPFGLPMRLVHLVLVNGRYVAPKDIAEHPLADGDRLTIWPPIAGG